MKKILDVNWNNPEYKTIELEREEMELCVEGCKKIARYKMANPEKNFPKTLDGIYKRFFVGLTCETAVRKALGKDMRTIDFSAGNSSSYNYADLKDVGLNIGIKSQTDNNAIVISDRNIHHQIICHIERDDIEYEYDDEFGCIPVYIKKIVICGIASPKVLRKYADRDYILKPSENESESKKGFYGYQYISPARTDSNWWNEGSTYPSDYDDEWFKYFVLNSGFYNIKRH